MTFEEAKEKINELFIDPQVPGYSVGDFDPEFTGTFEDLEEIIESLEEEYSTTDKLSVEKLQEELESCIQTLIEASAAATITQDIVVGNLVDRKLADLAKTHKLAVVMQHLKRRKKMSDIPKFLSKQELELQEVNYIFSLRAERDKLQEQLQELAEENERLRNALEDIRTNTPIQELLNLPYGCACHEIASEALAAIGGDDE
ncbi:hypothetical protein [Lactococcus lactis]|uniref:hypothetical protein n=2 Tax=Lactococcus lactis TaxID=1358 RepID=UPI0022E63771|nr:hypothetical protein [Lactococcus lactis]